MEIHLKNELETTEGTIVIQWNANEGRVHKVFILLFAAMLVDENKRSLISFICSSTSICTWH